MKRMHPDPAEIDYSKELKLNIKCDDDDSHMTVLYCTVCITNLCEVCAVSIHSRKSLSKHQIVPLTEKPETSINCFTHRHKKAKLVCKEPNCDGMNNPTCSLCHEYDTHKDHKYDTIDNECDQLRKRVTDCLKEVVEKQGFCDKNLEEYDKCIATYSSTESDLLKNERDEISAYYQAAKATALKKLDDFAKSRIETLKLLKNRFVNDKMTLDNVSSELQEIEAMPDLKVLENWKIVEKLAIQCKKKISKSADFVPFNCYSATFPYNETEIDMEFSKNVQLQDHQKMLAVYYLNGADPFFESHEDILEREEVQHVYPYDKIYKYKNGRTVFGHYCIRPSDERVNLSVFKYVAVLSCSSTQKNLKIDVVREEFERDLWSRIMIIVTEWSLVNEKEYVDELYELAETDKRVEIVKYENTHETLALLLQE